MVKKPTLVLFLLLATLGLFAWFYEFSPASEGRKTTPSSTEFPRPFAKWELENIKRIEYLDVEGMRLNIYRGKEINSWRFDEIQSYPVNNGRVIQLLSELLTIKPQSKIPAVDSVIAMGLGKQSKVLTLTDLNENKIEIQIGTDTPTRSGTYIRVNSDYYIVNTPAIKNVEQLLTREGLIGNTEQTPAVNSTQQP